MSRDFIYVDDVVQAFVDVGLKLSRSDYGESFNIGSGRKTTIAEVVPFLPRLFGVRQSGIRRRPTASGT